jgi:alanine-glyoxylate transaminase / serine-glyoxylate transaminase / serine-pyruvate transaminase
VARAEITYRRLNPSERTLLGPDLSNPSPRARQGLIATLQGANDPEFLGVLEHARDLLRDLWRTDNPDTFIFPGSEEAGAEAVLANLIEPGDAVAVGVIGFAGVRLAEAAGRLGAEVVRVDADWGSPLEPRALEQVLAERRPRLVVLAHGDPSTGVLQPLPGLVEVAHATGAIVAADLSSTTAVVDVQVDDLGLDAVWTGSQKGLSAYPGLALVSFGAEAVERVESRGRPPFSWYLDLEGLRSFESDERRHQTVPAPLVFALTEMLELAYEQGMDYRESRHHNRQAALIAAFEVLGLRIRSSAEHRLPSVIVVEVPAGIDAEQIRADLRRLYRIDIAAGIGAWAGEVWRVGFQSHSAQPSYLVQLVSVLEVLLASEGYRVPEPGAAVETLVGALDP